MYSAAPAPEYLPSMAAPSSDGPAPGGGPAPRVVAGVLSGTSADGIDVALTEPRYGEAAGSGGAAGARRLAGLRLIAFETAPFPADLGARVRRVLDGGTPPLAEVAALHRDLGRAFGAAARTAAERAGARLDLVASHGQTVFHHDGAPGLEGVTLQLGDGCAVAEAAGCAAASDFRVRDCAAGGEGAPLVALVDEVLFADAPRPLALLNLGGIANWTVLAEEGVRPAFDTGPAGALLDGLARARLGRDHDEGGAVAAAGRPDAALLARLGEHPFLRREPPKTTGRDTFGEAWLAGILEAGAALGDADLLATGAGFVAQHAADGLAGSLGAGERIRVAVAGGGVHNRALMGALEAALGAALAARGGGVVTGFGTTEALGVPPDAREALAFAALGARLAIGEPSTAPTPPQGDDPGAPGGAAEGAPEAAAQVRRGPTGALPGRVLGKWSPAAVLPPAR